MQQLQLEVLSWIAVVYIRPTHFFQTYAGQSLSVIIPLQSSTITSVLAMLIRMDSPVEKVCSESIWHCNVVGLRAKTVLSASAALND